MNRIAIVAGSFLAVTSLAEAAFGGPANGRVLCGYAVSLLLTMKGCGKSAAG